MRAADGLVLGICNGFQILLEAGLLPGAMMRNKGLRLFVPPRAHTRGGDGYAVHMRRDARASAEDSHRAQRREIIFAKPGVLAELERNKQIIFHYVQPDGGDADEGRPRGESERRAAAIAGICNRERNVLGLMPHPERAVESGLGSADGW